MLIKCQYHILYLDLSQSDDLMDMYNSRMVQMDRKISDFNSQITSNNSKLSQLQSKQRDQQSQIGRLETELSQLGQEIKSLAEILRLINENKPRLDRARNYGQVLHERVEMDFQLELDEGGPLF